MVTVHLPNRGRMWTADVDGKRPESPVTTQAVWKRSSNKYTTACKPAKIALLQSAEAERPWHVM